ncbi:MAG: glycosyltransferase family 4 protein, partial [Solirubrobacterales bacterium]|nr:glycosyltransferase family 4 protein [Solirubrobacterales bacterium]
SDARPIYTTNTLDLTNVVLALRHAAGLACLLRRNRDARVLVPISQGRWGFLRDATLIALARIASRDVTLHLHGGLFDKFYEESPAWERWLIRRALRDVERAWVLTEAHVSIFDGLIPRERVRVLENTSEDVRRGKGEGLGAGRGERGGREFRLLFLSNLFPEKGCIDLIEALETLAGRAEGVTLRLIGEARPEVAEEIARRARALASEGILVEYGGVKVGEDKLAEYGWADAFALPSRYPPEGQPLVLLEAMSAGLPIIASDHSGLPWTVRDGVEGLIVGAGDVDGLGEAVMRLREDAALRADLGANARRRYAETYGNEAFYDALEKLALEV